MLKGRPLLATRKSRSVAVLLGFVAASLVAAGPAQAVTAGVDADTGTLVITGNTGDEIVQVNHFLGEWWVSDTAPVVAGDGCAPVAGTSRVE
jgi:hypothetical protein